MNPPSRMLAQMRWTTLGVCALWLVACEPAPLADVEATNTTTAQAQLQSTDACLQRDLGAPAETRQVTLDQAQTVRFSKGTEVNVPFNAFVFEDGTAPVGPVELRVKECYTLADFLSQGLHTQSGESLLESGGTILIHKSRAHGIEEDALYYEQGPASACVGGYSKAARMFMFFQAEA